MLWYDLYMKTHPQPEMNCILYKTTPQTVWDQTDCLNKHTHSDTHTHTHTHTYTEYICLDTFLWIPHKHQPTFLQTALKRTNTWCTGDVCTDTHTHTQSGSWWCLHRDQVKRRKQWVCVETVERSRQDHGEISLLFNLQPEVQTVSCPDGTWGRRRPDVLSSLWPKQTQCVCVCISVTMGSDPTSQRLLIQNQTLAKRSKVRVHLFHQIRVKRFLRGLIVVPVRDLRISKGIKGIVHWNHRSCSIWIVVTR